MRSKQQRQTRNLPLIFLALVVLSCVSRTTPVGRFTQSLAIATPGTFSLVSADPNVFSFAAVGDLHVAHENTARLRAILDAAAADGDEFLLLLGDIVDEGELVDVQAVAQEIQNAGWTGKVFSVAGNHDIFHDGWNAYRQVLGSSTYSFRAGNSKFIALDTADATLSGPQTQWLRDELTSLPSGPTFIFSHYLPVIPGVETWLKLASYTEAANLMSLATRTGVKAWIGAHYHSYVNRNIAGVDDVVAGGGGGRRMPPYSASYFYVRVLINGSTVTYQLKPTS